MANEIGRIPDIQKVIETQYYRSKGFSYHAIARILGKTYKSIYYWNQYNLEEVIRRISQRAERKINMENIKLKNRIEIKRIKYERKIEIHKIKLKKKEQRNKEKKNKKEIIAKVKNEIKLLRNAGKKEIIMSGNKLTKQMDKITSL